MSTPRTPRNPLQTLSEELQTIISDPQLTKLTKVLNFHSVDQVVAWAGSQTKCPPSIPAHIFEKLQTLYNESMEINSHQTNQIFIIHLNRPTNMH